MSGEQDMQRDKPKIEVAQLWMVKTGKFMTSGQHNRFNRPINLHKYEVIEIRYAYEWHFRTADNNYFHATPEMIIKNCVLIGRVWENIRWSNRCNLKEILDKHFYDGDGLYLLYCRDGMTSEGARKMVDKVLGTKETSQ